jgi:two-component system cell cycle sensor histidine kinase/response regulator CckA
MPIFGMRPANLLETVFDEMLIAVVVLDEEHRIAYANDEALRLLGVPRSILASPVRLEDMLQGYRRLDSCGNEIPIEELPLLRALAGEDIEPHNMKLVHPDGRFKWLHVSAHPFAAMGLKGALMVATDETREVELQRVAVSMQKLEMLSTLAGSLAHNFNNLISIIDLSARACLENVDVRSGDRTKLQLISDAARHAGDLTKRLAQFSRTQQLKPKLTSINHLVCDAVALIEPLIFRNIQVITKLHPDLPDVEVDPFEMQQVILNLLLNARDAMPQGGQLTVATDLLEHPTGAEGGGDGRQSVAITVSDTGTGIPEGIVGRIFEPFFTTKPNGTGLGLASAQGIVRQHEGDIEVQSVAGKGTQFTVYLPQRRRTPVIVDVS